MNSSRLILVLQKGGEVHKLTSQSSTSRIYHCTIAAKCRRCGPKTQTCNGYVYGEIAQHVLYAQKIAILAIVGFAIPGTSIA